MRMMNECKGKKKSCCNTSFFLLNNNFCPTLSTTETSINERYFAAGKKSFRFLLRRYLMKILGLKPHQPFFKCDELASHF